MRTKKYATSVRVSTGVIRDHLILPVPERSTTPKPGMNPTQLRALIEAVASGTVSAEEAERRLAEAMRAQPFEDLGFARVDHHRAMRQGFPEVILGLGKTPAQIAGIAAGIAGRGSTLLVTRASAAAFDA